MKELLDNFIYEKEIIEQLINIDNDIMNCNNTYKDYYNDFFMLLNSECNKLKINDNVLFITEGNPLITLDILRRIDSFDKEIVIFINQGFVGINKWLFSKCNLDNVVLDTNLNYNKYIDKGYKVYSLGEEGLNNQVMEDFYGER